jgi:hypothetical protein
MTLGGPDAAAGAASVTVRASITSSTAALRISASGEAIFGVRPRNGSVVATTWAW